MAAAVIRRPCEIEHECPLTDQTHTVYHHSFEIAKSFNFSKTHFLQECAWREVRRQVKSVPSDAHLQPLKHVNKAITWLVSVVTVLSMPVDGLVRCQRQLEDRRSQRLMEEGTRNELAAQTRLRQEEKRLKSAKMLQEEIEETLQPMGMEERQDFNRAVNAAVDLISQVRAPPGTSISCVRTLDDGQNHGTM